MDKSGEISLLPASLFTAAVKRNGHLYHSPHSHANHSLYSRCISFFEPFDLFDRDDLLLCEEAAFGTVDEREQK